MNEHFSYDERRDLFIGEDANSAIEFAANHFINLAIKAIKEKGSFTVALSGGGTPKPVYEKIASHPKRERVEWDKVLLFWSDERCVAPTNPESNFKMAMDAGFSTLPILENHIFRMKAEMDLEESAKEYEKCLFAHTENGCLDLVVLGMGNDGHIASLFPHTHGLHAESRSVIANYIPEKGVWRMSLTMECINRALHAVLYVMGKDKADMVHRALNGNVDPDLIPASQVGTSTSKALWILDKQAASSLIF